MTTPKMDYYKSWLSKVQSQYALTSLATAIANDYSLSKDEQSHLQELVSERAMDFTKDQP